MPENEETYAEYRETSGITFNVYTILENVKSHLTRFQRDRMYIALNTFA